MGKNLNVHAELGPVLVDLLLIFQHSHFSANPTETFCSDFFYVSLASARGLVAKLPKVSQYQHKSKSLTENLRFRRHSLPRICRKTFFLKAETLTKSV